MDEPRLEPPVYYETHGRLWPWLFVFMATMLSAGFAADNGPVGWLGLLAIPIAALLMWGRRLAVRCDETGLTELCWPNLEKHHFWSSIREVEERPRSLRLVTDDGVIRFGRMFLNRRAVAMLARRRRERQPTGTLDAAEVERRLGAASVTVKAYGINRATIRWWPGLVLGIFGVTFIAMLFAALGGDAEAQAMLLPWVVGLGCMGAWLAQQGRDIQRNMVAEATATAAGIDIASGIGRIFVPWHEVGGVERWTGGNLYLSTLRGDFQVQAMGRQVRRFQEAVDRVLAARDEGAELPRMEGASDSALSLAETDSDAAMERGISRAE